MSSFDRFGLRSLGRSRKRVCRGPNSGKRAGRGNKGTGARNRGWRKLGIQNGGQNPMYRMHAKIGFVRTVRGRAVLDAQRLSGFVVPGTTVSIDFLKEMGLVGSRVRSVKILNSKVLASRWPVGDGVTYSGGNAE